MTRILAINSSNLAGDSSSRQVLEALLSKLQGIYPNAQIVRRDLVRDAIPHFAPDSPEHLALSDRLCREVIEADALVIASPMWNFSIPSVLKAWVDHLVRAGITFQYSESGPVGLLPGGKRLWIIESSGGDYSQLPAAALNHVSPYLAQIFAFMGITHTETVRISGTAYRRNQAVADALAQVSAISSLPKDAQ